MKVSFETIWKKDEHGLLKNNSDIRLSGITAKKGSISLKEGSSFGGIDWTLFEGRDIDVVPEGDLFVITGIY